MARRRRADPIDASGAPAWLAECVVDEREDLITAYYYGWLFAVVAWWEGQYIDAADAPLDGPLRVAAPGERVSGWEEVGALSRPLSLTERAAPTPLPVVDRDGWLSAYVEDLRPTGPSRR